MNPRQGAEASNTTLFSKPADREDGRPMFQNNHPVGVWMPGSFMNQRSPMPFFTVLEEKNVIVCTETQMIPNSQSNLEKEKWHWKNQAPDLRLYYKATIVKTISIVKTI